MLANSVSPPVSGSVWMRRIEPMGGSGSQETSECQLSPATRFDDSSAWMIITSGWPSRPGSLGCATQLAEVRAETHLRLDGDVLVAEEDHLVGDQGIVDLSQPRLIDRVEVDSVDLSTQDRREAGDG